MKRIQGAASEQHPGRNLIGTSISGQKREKMKKKWQVIPVFAFMLIISACTVTDKSERGVKLSIQAGINQGGITENTDLSVVPDAEPTPEATIDAYSGATSMGANMGLHANKPLKFGEIETGLDYMYNHQEFTYADAGNMYIGSRDLSVHQFMIPLTYNFELFEKMLPTAEIQLKIGYLGQINFVSCKGTGILPEYSINRFSNGGVFGISAYPFSFANGSKLGFYLDAYRGTQIYIDHYNQERFEMPGSSFVKGGLKYRFK